MSDPAKISSSFEHFENSDSAKSEALMVYSGTHGASGVVRTRKGCPPFFVSKAFAMGCNAIAL